MLFKKTILLVAILLSSALSVADQVQRTFTVKQIFSEGEHGAGFYPNEALPECKWALMYIDLSKESGKAIFSMLLAAKASGQKIVRIDYSVATDDTCKVTGLHIK